MEVHSSKNNDFEKAKDCWDCKDTKLEKDGKGSFPLSPPFSTCAFEFSHFHFCTHEGLDASLSTGLARQQIWQTARVNQQKDGANWLVSPSNYSNLT